MIQDQHLGCKMKITRRTVLLFIMMLLLAVYACAQPKSVEVPQQVPLNWTLSDYEKFLKERYQEVMNNPKDNGVDTWRAGMLREHSLVLMKIEMLYKAVSMAPTNDGRILVCGALQITGFGQMLDGQKKRIISRRAVCHIFKENKLDKALNMGEENNKLLNGWEDSSSI
jgi:hypothetical protein